MSLSTRALETLIDLVENKLTCLEVFDREDARELSNLEHCLNELQGMAGQPTKANGTPVLNLSKESRGRSRVRAAV